MGPKVMGMCCIFIFGVPESGMDVTHCGWEIQKMLHIWVVAQNRIKDLCTG